MHVHEFGVLCEKPQLIAKPHAQRHLLGALYKQTLNKIKGTEPHLHMLAGWANDGQPVFTARFDSAESRSFTPQLVRETIRHALGLLPPKLGGVKASEKCPSCRAPFGPHGEHIDVCRCSPTVTLDHDDAARALTRGLRRIGINALHESTAPIDVSVDPDHVNTPDVMIESLENGPFSLDVAIMRPGVSLATSVSATRGQYVDKMRAYYGRLAGDALICASTSA